MKITSLFLILFMLSGCSQFSEPQGLSNRVSVGPAAVQVEEPLEATFSSIKLNIINKKCLSCHNPKSSDQKAKDIPLTKETEVVKGFSDLGDLVVPGNAAKSIFYLAMVDDDNVRGRVKSMPPKTSRHGRVTADELQIVAAWINGVVKVDTTKTETVKVDPGVCKETTPATNSTAPNTQPGVAEVGVAMPSIGPPPTTGPVNVADEVLDYALIKTKILEKKCITCHKSGGKSEELIFGSRDELLELTTSYGQLLIVAGKPEQSLMYLALIKDEAIRQDTRLMPPKKDVVAGKVEDITEQEANLIKKWISEGAK